jgi:hypothetical protein
MLHAGVLSYFAANDVNLKMLNHGGKVLSYRLPSFGTFSTSLKPSYFFGIPQRVQMEGIRVNIDFLNKSLWAVDNDRATTIAITQQIGLMASSLEQRIPELLFTEADDEQPASGVSAVHALMTAVQEGQQIYQVTQENIDVVLPLLNVKADVKDDIRTGVAAGKIATIPQNQVTIGDWVGVGYIITDPRTGTGAYLISGGYNGALEELEANYSGAMNLSSLMDMLPQVGLGALAPLWDNIFEYLKCSDVDELIKDAILVILTTVMIVLILAAIWAKRPEALAPLIRLAMSLLTVLSNRVAMAVGPKKTKCGSPKLKLISIHFSANDPKRFLKIWKDEVGGATPIEIDKPQWVAKSTFLGKNQSQPLAYVAGKYQTFIKMKATFKVVKAPKEPMTVDIKTQVKIGNANQNLKARVPSFNTDSFKLQYNDNKDEKIAELEQEKHNPLNLNLTQFFNPMNIKWKFSYKGNRTKTISTSKHKVYVTLDEPNQALEKLYLSYLHWAISDPGATTKSEVVRKTWQHFASRELTAWDGKRKLRYYPLGGHPDDKKGWPEYCLTSPNGYGQCDNFAYLFSDTLMVNDIKHLLISVTTKTLGVHPQKGGIREWMLIKKWTVKGKPSFLEKETKYQWKLQLYKRTNNPELGSMISPGTGSFMPGNRYGDFVNKTGLPGQNIVTPSEKFFEEHQLVKITESLPTGLNPYFDPSYGVTFQNQLDFETNAVYGYGYGELGEEDEKEKDKLNFKIRKAKGLDNIQFTSTSPYMDE